MRVVNLLEGGPMSVFRAWLQGGAPGNAIPGDVKDLVFISVIRGIGIKQIIDLT